MSSSPQLLSHFSAPEMPPSTPSRDTTTCGQRLALLRAINVSLATPYETLTGLPSCPQPGHTTTAPILQYRPTARPSKCNGQWFVKVSHQSSYFYSKYDVNDLSGSVRIAPGATLFPHRLRTKQDGSSESGRVASKSTIGLRRRCALKLSL